MVDNQSRLSLAVVVASGGLDSCVTAALAARDHRLAMLHVDYGQRTVERERRAFHDIADALHAECRLVIPMDHLHRIGGSCLTDTTIAVPVHGIQPGLVPVTYVPFRNANLFAAAVSWAEVIGAAKVFVGINQVDSSGYPDCSESFLSAFNQTIRFGTRPETRIEVIAPLLKCTKADIVLRGIQCGAPFDKSWSCYQNNEVACGRCDSCRLRLAGFAAVGIRDPIPYLERPETHSLSQQAGT
ncbi:7-cyano-7-deazaguanine synthase QueC [bacterium]|nr:7-cyano-7-deazaguanine synthase QueC [candidate division CSSED10-310 bacterium]